MTSQSNSVLSGIAAASDPVKTNESIKDIHSIAEDDNSLINPEQNNNLDVSDEVAEKQEDFSIENEEEDDDYVDFNALNANMDEDEEGEEDEEEKAKIENNRFQTNIVNENQNDFAPMKNPETQNNANQPQAELIPENSNLLNADIKNTDKEHLINMLLNSEITPKNATNQSKIVNQNFNATTNIDSPNKSKRYRNIQSKYKKESLLIDPNYKGGPEKFFINATAENPEFEADLQNAQRKLVNTSKNASKTEKDKIINKLLFQDFDKKVKIKEEKITVNDIKNKVADFLDKKQKKLEEFQQIKDEEMMKYCTFKPEIISEKLFPEKRNINTFLEDQKNHLKKVHDKIEKIKEEDQKKIEQEKKPLEKYNHELYYKMLSQSQNSEDKSGEKKRNKSASNPKEKGYIRLYNLRNQKEKANLLKSPQFNSEVNKANIKKKPLEERDEYLKNLYKSGLNFIEKVEGERTKFLKDEKNQMKLNTNFAWAVNNKFFLEKVMQTFKLALKSFSKSENKSDNTNNNNNNINSNYESENFNTNNNNNLYEIDEENKFKEEEKLKEKKKFNKTELQKFLFEFGFTTLDFSDEKNNKVDFDTLNQVENNSSSFQPCSITDNTNKAKKLSVIGSGKENLRGSGNTKKQSEELSKTTAKSPRDKKNKNLSNAKIEKEKINLQLQEKNLATMFVDNVIPTEPIDSTVNSNDLFLYLIGILNLYDYFVYSSYKKTNPITNKKKDLQQQSKINNKKIPKTEEEISLKSQIICEIKEEIKNKALKHMRYSSFDNENKLIITEENANHLKKYFHMFYLNFMLRHNMKSNTMQILRAGVENEFKQIATFKPKIDENSRKLYSEYKRKMNANEPNKAGEGIASEVNKEKEHMEYIENLLMGKKKKENEKALIIEQRKKEELKECTFKPNIESNYVSKKKPGNERENRFDHLYNLGKEMIINKKDKSKEELENEERQKFCSFKPNISKPEVKEQINSKVINDIYKEKNYELLYNRLKGGRLERYIKESVHDRGEFPEEINIYRNLHNDNSEMNATSMPNFNQNTNLTANSIRSKTQTEQPVNSSDTFKPSFEEKEISTQNQKTEESEGFNNDPERKDTIPLLIIDVNIRPGVKKKIYVYDGDTSEGLAERFSKEHNLDEDTKSKLQGLIQSHMSKLLMRIDEENQSVSEKSSMYNLT